MSLTRSQQDPARTVPRGKAGRATSTPSGIATRWRHRVFVVVALIGAGAVLLGGNGCARIRGRLEPAVTGMPSGQFQAGAAKVDITPMPGYPMGGHSIAGAVARGYWTRLYARAIYLEDAEARSLVLVSCDLWSLPAGLADRVAELVQSRPGLDHLGRENLILSATHTHQSPGNFSSCGMYNTHASAEPGFDRHLFEFLAGRIALAIQQSEAAKRPARLAHAESVVELLARNRSLPAFLHNPESGLILEDNASLAADQRSPDYPALEAYHAVDPRLRLLRIEPLDPDEPLIGLGVFFAVHPTVLSAEVPFYQSDLTGVATTLVEQRLRAAASSSARSPVVAFFNGAEGDVSPSWREQTRDEVVRLGTLLADAITHASVGWTRIEGSLACRMTHAPLADVHGEDPDAKARHTADQPLVGASALGGAEDGRTRLYRNGYVEGMTDDPSPDHGAKLPALDPRWLWFRSLLPLTRLAMDKGSVPRTVPLQVCALGGPDGLVLATLPGEFTTVMGRRITHWLAHALDRPTDCVLLIGLAGEYVSYFTTPEEYEAQHYEGASTLYGPDSGPVVGLQLSQLARQLTEPGLKSARDFNYRVGGTHQFNMKRFKPRDESIAHRALGEITSAKRTHEFSWTDVIPQFDDTSSYSDPVTPRVSVELQLPDETWTPLLMDGQPETDEGLRFATAVIKVSNGRSHWRAAWLPPELSLPSAIYRLRVEKLDGAVVVSPSFHPGAADTE